MHTRSAGWFVCSIFYSAVSPVWLSFLLERVLCRQRRPLKLIVCCARKITHTHTGTQTQAHSRGFLLGVAYTLESLTYNCVLAFNFGSFLAPFWLFSPALLAVGCRFAWLVLFAYLGLKRSTLTAPAASTPASIVCLILCCLSLSTWQAGRQAVSDCECIFLLISVIHLPPK